MKLLGMGSLNTTFVACYLTDIQQIKVHLFEGVIDLRQHAEEMIFWGITVKKTDGVEDVVEVTRRRHQHNSVWFIIYAVLLKHLLEFFPQRLFSVLQVILVVNGNRAQ